MTVQAVPLPTAPAVYRVIHLRSEDCVCRGRRQVRIRRPKRSIGPVMPCPQCTDPSALELFVAVEEDRNATGGGDAA